MMITKPTALAAALFLAACTAAPPPPNPVTYFEIPVADLDRATKFYTAVLGYKLDRQTIDGNAMALFPASPNAPGAAGALAQGKVYIPAKSGPLIYFGVPAIAPILARAAANGGRTLYPETSVGTAGHVAEFEDSEGNRIGLHSP